MSSTGERVVAGRYRLRRLLGQGAMGTVWEAFDEYLLRPVAVKEVLLPPGMPDDQAAELRERTLREARAIAALSHPNVITLHDVARDGDEPLVVMEYMLAHSLATLIDTFGAQPEGRAATIADAVAAGLAAAHQAGITHRDVKPGNVLIGVDGRVKLTDFGIARNVAERTLTSTGIMLGSPAYIAPEVAAGREVTPAADLWGLGATLFAVIEGRPPYDVHGAVLATVNQVVNGEVPRPSAEGPLSDIVAALMVKEPEKRISLREVRNRLHSLLPPPNTPLLPEEDLARLNEVAARWSERVATTPEKPAESATDQHDNGAGPRPDGSSPGEEQGSSPPLAAAPGPSPSFSRAPLSAETGAPQGSSSPAAEPGGWRAPGSAPLSTGSGARAAGSSLAPAPGPLPFETTSSTSSTSGTSGTSAQEPVRAGRGSVATGIVAFLAVLLFFAAAGGGFALSRYVGGEPLLPPKDQVQTTTSTPSRDHPDTVSPRSGNAGGTDKPGGGFTVPVPRDWIEFVEPIEDPEFPGSTRVYYVSPDGTRQLTVERFPAYYPEYAIADYLDRLQSAEPGVTIDIEYQQDISGIEPAPPESSLELNYRATANTKVLAPDDQVAQDQTRATFARLLPYAGDLWVVSVTVPIDQEDSGNELFERTVPEFRVTG